MSKKLYSLLLVLGLVTGCQSSGPSPESYDTVDNQAEAEKMNAKIQEQIEEVEVSDRVHFGFDKYELTPEAKATLGLQAEWLKQEKGIKVTVEGHCDERGTREYNLALGERRANSVKEYLVGEGVDAKRITTVSYGKEKPEFVGSGESTWAKNRRAVTVISE